MKADTNENPIQIKLENAYVEADGKFLVFNKIFNLTKLECGTTDNDIAWTLFHAYKETEKERSQSNVRVQELEAKVLALAKQLEDEKASVHSKVSAIIASIGDQMTKQKAMSIHHKMTKPKPQNYTFENPHHAVKGYFAASLERRQRFTMKQSNASLA